jgi:hypothetical protein
MDRDLGLALSQALTHRTQTVAQSLETCVHLSLIMSSLSFPAEYRSCHPSIMAKHYIISSSHYKKTRTSSTGVIVQEKGTKKQDDGVSYKQQQNTSTTSNNFSISLFRGIFVRRDQVPAPHIPVVDVIADGPISYER